MIFTSRSLREDQTPRLLARLDSGELDVALLALPYALGNVETLEIAEDRFWVVFPEGHPLCDRETVHPADVAPEDMLLLEDGHCLREHALTACALDGPRRNTAFQGTSLHTLVQMVANGLGFTLLPQMALDAGLLRDLDVAARPLGGSHAFRRIGLVWRPTSGRKETFRRLAATLKATMEQNAVTPPTG